jgi:hypothetical protein
MARDFLFDGPEAGCNMPAVVNCGDGWGERVVSAQPEVSGGEPDQAAEFKANSHP